MPAFKYFQPISLKSYMYFDDYDDPSLTPTSATAWRDDARLKLTFERGQDLGDNTVILSVELQIGGKDALSIKGLSHRVRDIDTSMNPNAIKNLTAGDDLMQGSKFADMLKGGGGNDRLFGGAGADDLYGGDGRDRLVGGAGSDHLFGGAGSDTFVFTSVKDSPAGRGRDVIHDFGRGDVIDLSAIDARTTKSGDQAFRFIGAEKFSKKTGELRVEGDRVLGDVNGDGVADFSIEVQGGAIGAGDFIL